MTEGHDRSTMYLTGLAYRSRQEQNASSFVKVGRKSDERRARTVPIRLVWLRTSVMTIVKGWGGGVNNLPVTTHTPHIFL